MRGLEKLLSGPTLVFGGRCVGAALGIIIQLFLARTLGAHDLGIVYVALAIGSVVAVFTAMGYPSVCVRFVRRYMVTKRPLLLAAFVRQARAEALVVSLAATVAALVFIWLVPISPDYRLPVAIGALGVPLITFLAVNGGLANAIERVDLSYLPDVLVRPAFWAGCLALAWISDADIDTALVMWASLAALATAVLVQSGFLVRLLPVAGQRHASNTQIAGLWRQAAFPMVAVTLLTGLLFDIDALLLVWLLPATELAILGICFKIAFFVAFAVHVVQQSVMPGIADALNERSDAAMSVGVFAANRSGIIISGVAFLSVAILGKSILGLFGESFVSGHSALMVLSLCPLVRAYCGPGPQILVLVGQQKTSLKIYAFGLFVLAALNVPLAMWFGVTGAASALLIATFTWSIGHAIAVRKAIGTGISGIASPYAGATGDYKMESGR